jgi:DNA-binding NarL/FixJ family response regulator
LPVAGAARRAVTDVDVRVLLCDDQALVRAGFRKLLDSEPDIRVVGEASDGLQAIEAARRLRPDVALMEVRLPKIDGIEVTRRLAGPRAEVRVPVVVLTTMDGDDYVIEALRAGASGFLLKSDSSSELLDAVRTVSQGGALLASSVTRRILNRLAAELSPDCDGQATDWSSLTARELKVLRLLAEGLSNAEIADILWVGEATVKSHVSSLLRKLSLRNRVQAVILAHRGGLVRRTQAS